MPEQDLEIEVESVRGFPANVRANVSFGDEGALLTALKAKAFDPSIFDESAPFFWTAVISNNSVDAYSSRMMPSSLKNYAADAEAGVAFQNSHNCRELPLGGSLVGRFVGGQGNGASRVEAAFYTIPDLQLGQLDTNQFIRGVRSSVIKDVSIGFYGGRSVCSLCKNDMWDWMSGTCTHWPGEEYETHDAAGKANGREVAIEQIEDARLAEVSGVYDGATFGAEIFKKAIAQIEDGNLKPETVRALESRYRIRLPGKRVITPGFKEGEREMSETTETETRTMPVITLREGEVLENIPTVELGNQICAIIAARDAEIAGLRAKPDTSVDDRVITLTAEVERLRPMADAGETYRKDLIEQALTEGVRAQGNAFPKETYRGMLEKAGTSIDEIKAVRDNFKASADSHFRGGRQTVDEVPPAPMVQIAPDAAFTA